MERRPGSLQRGAVAEQKLEARIAEVMVADEVHKSAGTVAAIASSPQIASLGGARETGR
jgi:hypothetical protein